MAIEFIYFDLGNVLLAFSHDTMCRQMAEVAGTSAKNVKQVLFGDRETVSLLIQYETGQVGTDAFYDRFCRATDTRPDVEALRLAAADIFTPIMPVWDIVHSLARQNFRLGVLSNTNAIQWDYATDGRFELLASMGTPGSLFELALASHLVGAMKPDPQIYQVAITAAGIAAEQILFVDDRPENIAGARQIGIDGVQFTSPDQLSAELARRGLEVSGSQ